MGALHPPTAPPAYPMTQADFDCLAAMARDAAGLDFPPAKEMLMRSRLTRRLRALNLDSFSAYCALLQSDAGHAERQHMISSLTTNVSSFFREPHHFDLLRDQVLPPLLDRARAGGRVRLWSAGCSTGQEPYSLAMTLLALEPDAGALDIRILATDIDPTVLARAEAGCYGAAELARLTPEARALLIDEAGTQDAVVGPELRRLISFRPLNLLASWPMRGPFDVIFCRNVVIYFAPDIQEALWPRFAEICAPGGWLIIGHSERVTGAAAARFSLSGATAYQHLSGPRPDAGPAGGPP